jgi:hypothetical protein
MSLVDYANEEDEDTTQHESDVVSADVTMNTPETTANTVANSVHINSDNSALNNRTRDDDQHEDDTNPLASVAAYEQVEEPRAPTLQSNVDIVPNVHAPPAIDYSAWGPPPPSAAPDPALVTKISNFHEFKRAGKSLNRNLRRAKDFKNPELLTTLVQFVGIDEIGTNYAKEVWDPHRFSASDYYKLLDQEQQQLVNAKTAPSSVKSNVSRTTSTVSNTGTKRKSQWDLSSEGAEPKKQRK